MPKSRTLPSKSKTHVLRAYRSRGRENRNLWLVYSHKTNRDWVLGSDRHLVHWITFLETNPDVRTFYIEPDDNPIPDGAPSQPKGADASAELRDGGFEYHFLNLSDESAQNGATDTFASAENGERVRIFTDADLFPLGTEAIRWLKVINYCAAIRDEDQFQATLACVSAMRGLGSGTLGQVLESLPDFDTQVAIGIFSRMAVQGDIAIDLSSSTFTLSSQWTWRATE